MQINLETNYTGDAKKFQKLKYSIILLEITLNKLESYWETIYIYTAVVHFIFIFSCYFVIHHFQSVKIDRANFPARYYN